MKYIDELGNDKTEYVLGLEVQLAKLKSGKVVEEEKLTEENVELKKELETETEAFDESQVKLKASRQKLKDLKADSK